MRKLHHLALFAVLSLAGGAASAQPSAPAPTEGGKAAEQETDPLGKTPWPAKPRLLVALDGRAVVAARTGLWERMNLFLKEDKRYAGTCDASPKALDVVLSEADELYVVRVERRVERCGWADASFNAAFEPELYAVSREGKTLMRHPPTHEAPLKREPLIVNGMRWPEEARLLAKLDGRAVAAAYAAVQDLVERFGREGLRFTRFCDSLPTAMEVLLFEADGMYVVRITPRLDRCGVEDPAVNSRLGSVLYSVSPEGKILARIPNAP